MSKTAVLIPCYNEEKTIAKVVRDFKKALPKAKIYVFDNNSIDNSNELASNAGAIVKKEYKQGKGNVVRTMFEEIDADVYFVYKEQNEDAAADDEGSFSVHGFSVIRKTFFVVVDPTIF